MKNEHKDELIGLCKIEIRRWKVASESNPNMRYMVELMEVALAALTAQPVKLPDVSAGKYYTEEGSFKAFDYKRDLKYSIRTVGYEVQE